MSKKGKTNQPLMHEVKNDVPHLEEPLIAITDATEVKNSTSNTSRLTNILENLMEQWNNSKETEIVNQTISNPRSLKLIILRANKEPYVFGALLDRGKVNHYESNTDEDFTTICTMKEDTLLDALLGLDKFNRPFNINYAWACGEIVFEGKDWFVHQAVIKEMVMHFRHILHIGKVKHK